MNDPSFLLKVLYLESKKRYFVFKTLFFAFFYLIFSVILINHASFWSFFTANYGIAAKSKILTLIAIGSFQALSFSDQMFIVLISLLFGLNLELVLRKLRFLASFGSLHIVFGSGLISIAATGCASCGLSIASFVGLSAVLITLPFHGIELYILSLLILILSLFYNLKSLIKACNIKKV